MAPLENMKKASSGATEGKAKMNDKIKSAPVKIETKKHCYFLDLPAELKITIYDMHFSSIQKKATLEWIHNWYVTENHTNEITFFTALLFTNKRNFRETYPFVEKYGKRLAMRLESINEDIECDEIDSDDDDEDNDGEADTGSPWAQYMEDKSYLCNRRCHNAREWAHELGLKR